MALRVAETLAVVGHPADALGTPLVRRGRAWVRETVARVAPWADMDVLDLLAAEVLTNAITHTASGEDGGAVVLAVRWSAGRVRVAVTDDGRADSCPKMCAKSETTLSGRGLALLNALASAWGYETGADADRRVTVWFELTETRT
ncbi:ATP-binding protein [Actinomadura parmotrematis]|uniref:ATP-binding protein n=1 Tax=Actinomadura parmotrematis TaxID=2864039 RepID=A0ABS7G3E8_9ACTN|nr:ATP-binding protein [Actinomadura parmotrematis]MBW8486342.1 ATP-binding protein [Actinomadura parmotrematis]